MFPYIIALFRNVQKTYLILVKNKCHYIYNFCVKPNEIINFHKRAINHHKLL